MIAALLCRVLGHRFDGDGATGGRHVRTCERCGLQRGAPSTPDPEDRTERAMRAIRRAERFDARAARAEPGPEQNQLRFMAETARKTSRQIMQDTAGGGHG